MRWFDKHMSQSTPQCHLFCSRCKADSRKSPSHYDRDHIRKYLDVVVVGSIPGGALCVCERCGYRYTSNSRAARRALGRLSNEKLCRSRGDAGGAQTKETND